MKRVSKDIFRIQKYLWKFMRKKAQKFIAISAHVYSPERCIHNQTVQLIVHVQFNHLLQYQSYDFPQIAL